MFSPFGSFSAGGREMHITTPDIPRNWYNYFFTDHYITFTSQVGIGQGFLQDDMGLRLMPVKGRGMYLTEGDSGYSLCGLPVYDKPDAYECVHRLGSSTITLERKGIRTQYTLFVPCDDDRLTGIEVSAVNVTNLSDKPREINIISYTDNDFDGDYRYQAYNTAAAYPDDKINGVHFEFRQPFYGCEREFCFFSACGQQVSGRDCARNAFIGPYGSLADPAAIHKGGCSDSACVAEKMGYAVQSTLVLAPGQTGFVSFVTGICESLDAAARLVPRFDTYKKVLYELARVEQRIERRLYGRLELNTPDGDLNHLLNNWLMYQTDMGSRWARVRHNGYRDMASDTECLAAFNPVLAWERIKRVLTYQYSNGYAPRTFIDGKIRDNNFSDCTVWLTFTVSYIIKELGDTDLLFEEVPFNDGSSASVFEHLRRSVDFLYDFKGNHGLIRIWGGDWNDCMNGVGMENKGVSIWLSIAWVRACRQLRELSEAIGEAEYARMLAERDREMCALINEYGWDEKGGYYIYARTDADAPVGASSCEEGSVFLNPQLWAYLAGGLGAEREEGAFCNACELLYDPLGTRVSAHPYTAKSAWIGGIAQKAPGVQENGGVYLHAMCWKLAVDALRGDEQSVRTDVDCIVPFRNPVVNGRAEPYIICNCYMGKETGYRYGTPGQSWRTASGQWFLKAMAQFVFGLQPELDGLHVRPCLPAGWDSANAYKRFRGCEYRITYERSGEKALYFNGRRLESDLLPPESGEVRVTF
ncbi:MAG: hypothetical protein IKR85_01295 [Clostridia bacterium]|nr:hypothetical protein [Clostridia bacterium]